MMSILVRTVFDRWWPSKAYAKDESVEKLVDVWFVQELVDRDLQYNFCCESGMIVGDI